MYGSTDKLPTKLNAAENKVQNQFNHHLTTI